MRRRLGLTIACAGMAAAIGGAARADAIDGGWCFTDGKFMEIKGPKIMTPAGTVIEGNYSRHAFSYVVPEGEPDAGAEIAMVLLNEETVELHRLAEGVDPATVPGEIWHRCRPQISFSWPLGRPG